MRKFGAVGISVALVGAALLVLAPSSSATHGALVADYRFVDSMTSTVAGAPALEIIGSGTGFATETIDGIQDRVLTWTEGSGLRLPGASTLVGDNYTMVLLIRSAYVSQRSGHYAKIVDWHDGGSWSGLYLEGLCGGCTDGVRTMFPYVAGGHHVPPNTWTQLTVVRFSSASAAPDGIQLRSYLDGHPSATVASDTGDGRADGCQAKVGGCDGSLGDAIRFFLANASNPGEPVQQAAGSVARIRIYRGAMTPEEVAALERAGDVDGQMSTPTPAPSGSPAPTATTSPPPVRQCNDGDDNDGDGKTDLDDNGCSRALDDEERSTVTVKTTVTIGRSGDAFVGKVGAKVAECRKRNLKLVRLTYTWDEYRISKFPVYKTVAKGRSDSSGRYKIRKEMQPDAYYYVDAPAQKVAAKRAFYNCKKDFSPYYKS